MGRERKPELDVIGSTPTGGSSDELFAKYDLRCTLSFAGIINAFKIPRAMLEDESMTKSMTRAVLRHYEG